MLQFLCTKDATEMLTQRKNGVSYTCVNRQAVPATPQVWQWQLHAAKLARQNVLVAMHVETRFAMIFIGLKKGDSTRLLHEFWERLRQHLSEMSSEFSGLPPSQIASLLSTLQENHTAAEFHTSSNRSVQAHINEVLFQSRLAIQEKGCTPDPSEQAEIFDDFINKMLRRIAGGDYFYPAEAKLLSFLRGYTDFKEADLDAVRERMNAAKRREFQSDIAPIDR